MRLIEYNTEFFIRTPHPRRLYLYFLGMKFNFYGKKAQFLYRLLTLHKNA